MSFHQGIDNKPRPRITPDNQPLWDGFRLHRLMIPWCQDCSGPHLPPGPVCPHCLSDRLEWRQATGNGTISTWVRVHRAPFPAFARDVPYNVIQVELEEGPRITASLLAGLEDRMEVGRQVAATYEEIDEALTLLRFRPI